MEKEPVVAVSDHPAASLQCPIAPAAWAAFVGEPCWVMFEGEGKRNVGTVHFSGRGSPSRIL
jgi:hypothetical protein